MNPDKNTVDKNVRKKADDKKSPETVETPTPPQHMDPSKKPAKENKSSQKKRIEK